MKVDDVDSRSLQEIIVRLKMYGNGNGNNYSNKCTIKTAEMINNVVLHNNKYYLMVCLT